MTIRKRNLYFVMAVLAVAAAGGVYLSQRQSRESTLRVEARIRPWHEGPRIMTQVMIERYGLPVITAGVATWYGRGPWKRIAVHGASSTAYLEHTVSYAASALAAEPLAKFGHGVRLDRDNQELSASSDSEAMNLLALNLADEIASGRRSPEEAREFYMSTAKLAAAGKTSPYLTKLLFAPYQPTREDRRRRGIGY